MLRTSLRGLITVGLISIGLRASVVAAEADRLSMEKAAIVIEADASSFVRHAVDNLAGYLQELTGSPVPVGLAAPEDDRTVIVIGASAKGRAGGASVSTSGLGAEGYVLQAAGDRAGVIIAAGDQPRGTMNAVYALMKHIRSEGGRTFLESPLSVRSTPTFATRGMHFNGWPFKYPHSFRRWSEQEWRQYLDLLAGQGVNLFFFWPFMEIIPTPLAPQDQSYLEECRRVIDYAQTQCGMQVWIMQCTNRVAKDDCGVADPKARPYWRPSSQQDLKPQVPEDLQRILASREVLYRALNNVDGVCNIDSDPGFCPDCPLDAYAQTLSGFRSLLDRWNVHGKQAKLMSWMWMGWGKSGDTMFDLSHQDQTLKLLKERLQPPWGPVPGRFDFLDLCRKNGLLGQSVLLQYGLIEDEPSYPRTNVGIDHIFKIMERDYSRNLDLPGAIGNVQTPLLQLPHIYAFTSCLWNIDYRRRSEAQVLLELADRLYPEQRQLVADGYLALKASDPTAISGIADRLAGVLASGRLGHPGVMGRKLFPKPGIVAESLLLQLRLRAGQERLMGITAHSTQAECVALLRECMDAYLAWDLTHGWHDFWGWQNIPLVPVSIDSRCAVAMLRLAQCLKTRAAIDGCVGEVAASLKTKYDPQIVEQGVVTPLTNAIASVKLNPATLAVATASVVPDARRYPPSAANDGQVATQYWPGAMVADNTEWFQLTWDKPQRISWVVARFLQHRSMHGRTIHLQHEVSPGQWEDVATAVVPSDAAAPHAVATFKLDSPIVEEKIRIVNLLDLYEVEVD